MEFRGSFSSLLKIFPDLASPFRFLRYLGVVRLGEICFPSLTFLQVKNSFVQNKGTKKNTQGRKMCGSHQILSIAIHNPPSRD